MASASSAVSMNPQSHPLQGPDQNITSRVHSVWKKSLTLGFYGVITLTGGLVVAACLGVGFFSSWELINRIHFIAWTSLFIGGLCLLKKWNEGDNVSDVARDALDPVTVQSVQSIKAIETRLIHSIDLITAQVLQNLSDPKPGPVPQAIIKDVSRVADAAVGVLTDQKPGLIAQTAVQSIQQLSAQAGQQLNNLGTAAVHNMNAYSPESLVRATGNGAYNIASSAVQNTAAAAGTLMSAAKKFIFRQ